MVKLGKVEIKETLRLLKGKFSRGGRGAEPCLCRRSRKKEREGSHVASWKKRKKQVPAGGNSSIGMVRKESQNPFPHGVWHQRRMSSGRIITEGGERKGNNTVVNCGE